MNIVQLIAGILITVTISFYTYIQKSSGTNRARLNEIDQMDSVEFNRLLRNLLIQQGYIICDLPEKMDLRYKVDLLLQHKNETIIVLAKRYQNSVDARVIDKILLAKRFYPNAGCWVITSSHFTDQAKQRAKINSVRLSDRHELIQWLQQN